MGRPMVRRLTDAGYQVSVLARSAGSCWFPAPAVIVLANYAFAIASYTGYPV